MPDNAAPTTLLHWLQREFPKGKRETFKQMLAHGRLRINGVIASKLTQPITAHDEVRVLPRGAATPRPRASLQPLRLVFEDADVLVVDKPAGLLTSTFEKERRATALAIVRAYVAAREGHVPVGLIHRLDRDASGLLVFSKSHRAYKSLKTQFFKHSVDRVYEAIVEGVPNPRTGRIESRLIERADGTVRSTDEHAAGQRAITDYEVIETVKPDPAAAKSKSKPPKLSRVHLKLLTGRKHQIRVHLSERGHPIVGDETYGASTAGPLRLRAIRLAFDHPASGERVSFELAPSKS